MQLLFRPFGKVMDNSDFSHLLRSGNSTSSAIHLGETQPQQAVEQVQQPTFTGRVTGSHDPENPILATLHAGQGVVTRAPRSAAATITRSMVTRSTEQHSPATDNPVSPSFRAHPFLSEISASQPIAQSAATVGNATTAPPMDPLAALAVYQPFNFADNQEHLYGGFDSFSAFLDTYLPEGLEAESFTSQPAGQTISAPVFDSPVIFSQVVDRTSSQDQPNASPETVLSEALETVIDKTTEETSHLSDITTQKEPQQTPQVSGQDNPPVIAEPSYLSLQKTLQPRLPKRAKHNHRKAGPPTITILGKVKRLKGSKSLIDEFLYRTDSIDRPYLCCYPGCGLMYKSPSHLRYHAFIHTKVSEFKCAYPECGSDKYFPSKRSLKLHINSNHLHIKRFSCFFCFQKFNSSQARKAHVLDKHPPPQKAALGQNSTCAKQHLCGSGSDLERRNFFKSEWP